MIGISVLAVCALAIALMVVLCATNRIQRNPFVGLRMPSLFASDAAWLEGHHAAILPTTLGALAGIGLAIVVYAIPSFAGLGTALALAAFLVALAIGAVRARDAAQSASVSQG